MIGKIIVVLCVLIAGFMSLATPVQADDKKIISSITCYELRVTVFSLTANLILDICNQLGYALNMVKSFAHKGLENYFYDCTKKGLQSKHKQKIADILDRLDASNNIKDMKYPGSDLHQLKGKWKGLWQ